MSVARNSVVPTIDYGIVGSNIPVNTNTLQDDSKNWGADSLAGRVVKVTSKTGRVQIGLIRNNTAHVLILATAWLTAIQQGDTYEILDLAYDPKVYGALSGLVLHGIVTGVPGANQFTIPTLAGLGAGKFADATAPWWALVYRDAGGVGALPQGEMQSVTAYNSVQGTFTAPGFGGGGVGIGDEILFLNPLIASIGRRADTATLDTLADIATTSNKAALRRILLRMSSDAFTANIQGAARTELDTMIAQLATYFVAVGAAMAIQVNGNAVRTNLQQVWQDFTAIFGADGVNVFNPTIQGAARTDLDTALNALATYLSAAGAAMNIQVNNQAARSNIEQAFEDFTAVFGVDGVNVFNPNIQGAVRTDLDAALAAVATYFVAAGAAMALQVNNQAARTNLQQALNDYFTVVGCDGANIFSTTIQGAARTTIETAFDGLAAYFVAAGGALSVTIDPGGTARTTLATLWNDLGQMLAGVNGITTWPAGVAPGNTISFAEAVRFIAENMYTKADVQAAGVLKGTDTMFALIKQAVTQSGLIYFGDITTAAAATTFASTDLIGREDDYFVGWWAFLVRDDAGTGVAPQGEWRQVTDYISATGTFTIAAGFSAAHVVGDQIMIVNPAVFEAIAMRGGAGTIQEVLDNQAAQLDLAEYPTVSITMTGAEQTVYASPGATADGTVSGATAVFYFGGGFIDWTGANFGANEDTTVKVKMKVDGSNYRVIYQETFLAAALPSPVATPFPRAVNTQPTPGSFESRQDIIVTIQQAAVGAGWNTLDVRTIDGARGG